LVDNKQYDQEKEWELFKDLVNPVSAQEAYSRLMNTRQNPQESLEEFVERFTSAVRVLEKKSAGVCEEMKKDLLIRGINEETKRSSLDRVDLVNEFDEVVQDLLRIGKNQHLKKKYSARNTERAGEGIDDITRRMDDLRIYQQRMSSPRERRQYIEDQQYEDPLCIYCDRTGHLKRNCRDLKAAIEDGDVIVRPPSYLILDRDGYQIPTNWGRGGIKRIVEESRRKEGRTRAITAEMEPLVQKEDGSSRYECGSAMIELEREAMDVLFDAYVEAKRSYDRTFGSEEEGTRKRRVQFKEIPKAAPLVVEALEQLQERDPQGKGLPPKADQRTRE
jgi:hypothetical protein